MKQRNYKQKALLFTLCVLPFMLNIALIDFLIPIKYDVILDNLPFFGFLVTLAWLATSFLDFSIGNLTDRIGIRKTIQLGILMSFAGTLIFALSGNFLGMTLGIFLWGLSYVSLTIPMDTYLFSVFPKNYRGSAYGIVYFFYNFVYALVPLICLGLIQYFGINYTILFSAIIVMLSFPLSYYINGKDKEPIIEALDKIVERDGLFKKGFVDLRKMNLKEISLLVNMFLFGLWFMVIMIGAPLLFFHGQHDLIKGAWLTFAFMIPFAFFELLYGKMADHPKKRIWMINSGFLLSGLFLIIFFLTKNYLVLLGVAILITLATNMAWVASEVHVSKYLPKNKKGELMGVFITGKDIGFDLAPLFYGLFAVFGLKVPFIILGILLLCGWIFFRIAWRKN